VRAALCLVTLAAVGCQSRPSPTQPPAGARGFELDEVAPGRPLAVVLSDGAAKAKAKGLRPFLYIGATWCQPCQKLHRSLDDERMVDAFRGTYVIHLDLDAWERELPSVGLRVAQVPVFFQLDAQGKPTGKSLDGGAWNEDVPAEMAPPLKRFFNAS
jgi:hypothetical protein